MPGPDTGAEGEGFVRISFNVRSSLGRGVGFSACECWRWRWVKAHADRQEYLPTLPRETRISSQVAACYAKAATAVDDGEGFLEVGSFLV